MSLTRRVVKWTVSGIAGIVLLVTASPWLFPGVPFLPRSGCPILAWVFPLDHSEIRADDYLEWRVLPGLSSWIPFRLRIYGDGRVERDTVVTVGRLKYGCPLHASGQTGRISPGDANKLLSEARDQGFCRLCAAYHYENVTDLGTSELTVSLNNRVKVVQESSTKLPPLFEKLTRSAFDLAKMEDLVNRDKFSAERTAECQAFMKEQESGLGKKD